MTAIIADILVVSKQGLKTLLAPPSVKRVSGWRGAPHLRGEQREGADGELALDQRQRARHGGDGADALP